MSNENPYSPPSFAASAPATQVADIELTQPPLETFGGNKLIMGLAVVLACLALLGAFASFRIGSDDRVAVFLGLSGLCALWFGWLRSIRVTLHDNGIAYRSWLGSKAMRWNEVIRFYYNASNLRVNLIPVGMYYTFSLHDTRGRRLILGNRVQRTRILGDRLIALTTPALLQKCMAWFDSGAVLDYGVLRLSRDDGIQIKQRFHTVNIALKSLARCDIQAGHLYLLQVGKKSAIAFPIGNFPNAFVFVGLVNAICIRESA